MAVRLAIALLAVWAFSFLWFCRWPERSTINDLLESMESVAPVGTWLAGINGVGLVTAEGLQISAHTAFTTASDHFCEAVSFMFDNVKAGKILAGVFLVCGVAALVAATVPRVMKSIIAFYDRWSPYELELQVPYLFLAIQIFLVTVSLCLPAYLLFTVIHSFNPTAEVMTNVWAQYAQKCAPSSARLYITIPPSDWHNK